MSDAPPEPAEPLYQPHPDAAWRTVDGHVFIITGDNRQHELAGEVECLVWTSCDQSPMTHPALVTLITETFAVDTETASRDLRQFIDVMLARTVLIVAQ
jgi:hypothetical protein